MQSTAPFFFVGFVLFFWSLLSSTKVQAQFDHRVEQLGQFRFAELSLSPQFRVAEPSEGGIELVESSMGFLWLRDETLSAHFAIGTPDLISNSIWFSESERSELALIRAYLEAKTRMMNFRVGRMQVPFGFEGSRPEWYQLLPQSLVRRADWFVERDDGLEIEAVQKPFSVRFMVHNGESGSQKDSRTWATGQWRYINDKGHFVLLSGSVGGTGSESTSGSTRAGDAGFVFYPNQKAKFRMGALSLGREWARSLFLLEAGQGQILQGDQKESFQWGQADLAWNLGGDLALLARHEFRQANKKDLNSKIESHGLGFSVSAKDRLSQFSLFFRQIHERPQTENNEALLLFRLNSNILSD